MTRGNNRKFSASIVMLFSRKIVSISVRSLSQLREGLQNDFFVHNHSFFFSQFWNIGIENVRNKNSMDIYFKKK